MLSSEIFQICTVGQEYFLQVENYIDLTGMVFMYLYSATTPKNEWDEELDKQNLSIGVFLNLGNFILQVAWLTKKLRTTWLIIENSIVKAIQYMVIPLMFLVIFALCKFINDSEPFPVDERYGLIFGQEYQQMFGENMEKFNKQKPAVIVLYILGTFLINIVCLNILISVVTDNYDLVI